MDSTASTSTSSSSDDPVALALMYSDLDQASLERILSESVERGPGAVDVELDETESDDPSTSSTAAKPKKSTASSRPWVPHTESEPLLVAVSKRRCLFDTTSKDNKDDIMKSNAWASVAEELGRPVTGKLNFVLFLHYHW